MIVEDGSIQELRGRLGGRVFLPGGEGYDDARKVFNAMIDRRPALIVRCTGVADVIAAVNFAREASMLVSVRGGGHNVAGHAVCDGGVVIDLSAMKRVRVDPRSRTARAEGGSTWGDFDHATQAFGLATTGGIVPSTGIAGLTLGGGIGYLNRKFGLACDNLLSADVVTADGQLLTASATENEDLFWGLRGGGGNLGVVTSFEYQVHNVGPVLGGELVYRLDQAKEALRFYRDWSSEVPDEVRADPTLVSSPDGPGLAIIVCYCGAVDDGEKVLQPAPVPYATVQNLLTEVFQPGRRHYWKSGFLGKFSDEAIEAIVDSFATAVPPPFAAVAIEHLGGAISRVGERDTAFSHRHATHSLLVLRMWHDPAESAANMAWGRACYDAAEPFLENGVYVNYLADEGDPRIRAAYGANYERLVEVKTRYDPTNLFRLNQNVTPVQKSQLASPRI
jgi:FAD/FMN-containing dehydrogenase